MPKHKQKSLSGQQLHAGGGDANTKPTKENNGQEAKAMPRAKENGSAGAATPNRAGSETATLKGAVPEMIQQPAGEGDVAPRCSNGADVTLESPEEFTNSLVTVLLHSVPAINVSIVSPLKLAFEYRGATGQHDLSNVYRLYCERPEKRDELLEDFSSMARDLNGQHIDRRRILPVVRNSQFYGDAFHEPYNSELHILYVEFRSPAMRIPKVQSRRHTLCG